jgi:hypothetical protein
MNQTGRFSRDWDKMTQKMQGQQAGKSGPTDARFYKPRFNKDGTFSAVIRFLPARGDEMAMVKKYSHYFKGPGGKYDEECLTTIGQDCPVCDQNKIAWNAGDKQTCRNRARVNSGISNIFVINDPQQPECNGKVFLYEFGKRILERVNQALKPDNPTIMKKIDIFDYYVGANFFLIGVKTKPKEGDGNAFSDFTQSRFDNPSVLGDDAYIELIEKQLHSVEQFVAADVFKPYNELYKLFCEVTGKPMVENTAQNQFQQNQSSAAQPQTMPPVAQPVMPPVAQPAPIQQQTMPPVAQQTMPPVAQPVPVQQPVMPPVAQPAPIQQQTMPPVAQPIASNSAPIDEPGIDDMSEDDFFNKVRTQS